MADDIIVPDSPPELEEIQVGPEFIPSPLEQPMNQENPNPLKRPASPPTQYRTPSPNPSTLSSVPTPDLSFHTPTKRAARPDIFQSATSRDYILQARDKLIRAAMIEKCQEEKTRILDLLQIFQEYTEKKRLTSVSNILANQISDLERVARSLKNAPKATNEPTRPQTSTTPQAAPPKSFAAAAASPPPTSTNWQLVGKKGKTTPKPTPPPKENHREKRLVLVQTVKTQDIDPLQLRNNFNEAFRKHSITEPVVASVAKSRMGQNIVITTTDRFNADFLLEHEAVWQSITPYSSANKDSAWFKVVAHGIPIRDFNNEKGMALLKDEVETFNKGLKVMGSPRWLTSSSARETKRTGSVVIAFSTEKERSQAIRSRLYIAGSSVKTEKLLPFRADTQCSKCQGFGHSESKCRSTYRCRLCGEGHPTDMHVCATCEVRGKRCPHLVAMCCNCKEGHTADNDKCVALTEARAKTQTILSRL